MSRGSMFSHVFSPGLLTRSATSSAKEAERSRTTFPRNAFEPGTNCIKLSYLKSCDLDVGPRVVFGPRSQEEPLIIFDH